MTDLKKSQITRRQFTAGAAALTTTGFAGLGFAAEKPKHILKKIPSTGELIPVIGMGTWQTFNVGNDKGLRDARTSVLKTFLTSGGTLIDSSPMYGSSQKTLGYALGKLKNAEIFSADKIWTRDGDQTLQQLKTISGNWGVANFDLMQVHNLLAWEDHLPKLFKLKADKKLRYVGITTSHGRRHSDCLAIMKKHPIDFIQLSYNINDRDVEKNLLPLAKEKGIAVIANRPFDGGSLVKNAKKTKKTIPAYAAEFGCKNWAEFLLKYVVSHPAMTVAIPATTKVAHMIENMGSLEGDLPDSSTRKKMEKTFATL